MSGLFFWDSKIFSLLIWKLIVLAYSVIDSNRFALINLEALSVLAYFIRDSKIFALFF